MTSSARALLDANPGSLERRSLPVSEFEFRTGNNNTLRFSGYASVFNRGYDILGGPAGGGFTEIVTCQAFDKTLQANPDVHLLINHAGLPLARTKSGTLRLSADSTGLLSEADLDLRDDTVRSLAVKMERRDVDEMSFAFRVLRQQWSADDTERSLNEVSIHKGDVSIVSFGANPHTSAAIRSAVERLTNLSESDLVELRSMSKDVDRAVAQLLTLRDSGELDHPEASTLAQAVHDMCVEAGAECNESQPDTESLGDSLSEMKSKPSTHERRGLSLSAARRMCRPIDSPDALTITDAKKLAS